MSEFPKWPLVVVEWLDATGSQSWQEIIEVSNELAVVRSVGWLAKKDKRALTLYSALSTLSDNLNLVGHSQQVIPMSGVTKIKRIR